MTFEFDLSEEDKTRKLSSKRKETQMSKHVAPFSLFQTTIKKETFHVVKYLQYKNCLIFFLKNLLSSLRGI